MTQPPPSSRSAIIRRRPPAVGRRHLALSLALLSALASTAPPARAQDSVYIEKYSSRSRTLAGAGILIGGLFGLALASSQKPPAYSVAVAGAALGGLVGWFFGKQADQLHAAQYRGVRPITFNGRNIDLDGEPAALAVHDSLVAVGGSKGVELFISSESLIPRGARAGGLLGIATVEVAPASEWLAVGAEHGLYLFPPERGRGSLVSLASEPPVVATAGHIISAHGDSVDIIPVGADSVAPWPAVDLGAPVRALAVDETGAVLWAVTDKELVALRAVHDSLVRVGQTPFDGAARRVAAGNGRVAIAVGEKGVRVFDAADPAKPTPSHTWTVARFAYDVSLEKDRMFVAAGPEGVYVAEFHGRNLATIGVARSLGFVSAIVSRGGYTYLLDRRTNKLRRIYSDLEAK